MSKLCKTGDISPAVFIYLRFYTILTQTAPQNFDTNSRLVVLIHVLIISGCTYISLAALIFLWLISGCTYISLAVLLYLWLYLYISGCTYISLAVLIYLRLYLYISGCTYTYLWLYLYVYISGCIYISPVLHNFDTNDAPYMYVCESMHCYRYSATMHKVPIISTLTKSCITP